MMHITLTVIEAYLQNYISQNSVKRANEVIEEAKRAAVLSDVSEMCTQYIYMYPDMNIQLQITDIKVRKVETHINKYIYICLKVI
jgi:hypothetical protein